MENSEVLYIALILVNIIFIELVINAINYSDKLGSNIKNLLPVMIVMVVGIVDLLCKHTMIRMSILLFLLVSIMSTVIFFYEYISKRLFYYMILIYVIYSLYVTFTMSAGSGYVILRVDLFVMWIIFATICFCAELYKKICSKSKEYNQFIHIVGAVFDVLVFFVIFIIQSNYNKSSYITQFYKVTDYLFITLSVMLVVVYYALLERKAFENEMRQKISEFDYVRNQAEVENIKEMYNGARKIRHNYTSSVMGLKQMLAEGKYEKIDKYLDELTDTINLEQEYIRYCDNSIVNYILNRKAKLCRSKEIDFKCMVGGDFENISDVDLSILFGNLLDNAIEAAQQADQPFINVNIYCLTETRIIIENSVKAKSGDKEYSFKTGKADADNHGFGVKSIYEIVEKNHGSINYQVVNENMICNIII